MQLLPRMALMTSERAQLYSTLQHLSTDSPPAYNTAVTTPLTKSSFITEQTWRIHRAYEKDVSMLPYQHLDPRIVWVFGGL